MLTTFSNGLTAGINLSYDQAFDTRFSADIKYRFGSHGHGAANKQQPAATPMIQALIASPTHRDVRLHDVGTCYVGKPGCCHLNDNPEEQIYRT